MTLCDSRSNPTTIRKKSRATQNTRAIAERQTTQSSSTTGGHGHNRRDNPTRREHTLKTEGGHSPSTPTEGSQRTHHTGKRRTATTINETNLIIHTYYFMFDSTKLRKKSENCKEKPNYISRKNRQTSRKNPGSSIKKGRKNPAPSPTRSPKNYEKHRGGGTGGDAARPPRETTIGDTKTPQGIALRPRPQDAIRAVGGLAPVGAWFWPWTL